MAPTKILPPRDLVRRLLDYDSMTGIFVWHPRPRESFATANAHRTWNARYAGQPAGNLTRNGYHRITLRPQQFLAHRLAWLYVHGEPIPDEIDHADRDPLNNRITNLRAASQSQNLANGIGWRNASTGIKGVWRKRKKYAACIKLDGRPIYLGTFDTIEEAAAAYRDAAIRLYGEFARWE